MLQTLSTIVFYIKYKSKVLWIGKELRRSLKGRIICICLQDNDRVPNGIAYC